MTHSDSDDCATPQWRAVKVAPYLSLSSKQIFAARKIIKFLALCRRVRLAYEKQFREILLASTLRLQRNFRRMRLRLRAKKFGLHRAELFLDTKKLNLGQVSKVEVFGEFSGQSSHDAWGLKIACQQNQKDEQIYSVTLDIKIGQKFKFIIDGGRQYATSAHYM